ncbi:MAG: 4Fe-4S dicluster domain-containing protein [Myxococcales bacterium]|nr:4Fe-4S dicluster domain-containing protein [Myxococcales bacterium]
MDLNRRDFLKSASLATAATATACTIDARTPIEHVLPYVQMPEDELPGTATYFSTACGECASGCGAVARAKEGRVVMVEGNPDWTEGHGLCTRGHFGLVGAYSPERVEGPVTGGANLDWDTALQRVAEAVKAAQAAGKSVAWLGNYRTGSLDTLLGEFGTATGLRRVHWEAFGVESLLAASRAAFGVATLPTYELANAQVILSFGMDFLGTAYGAMGMSKGWSSAKNPANGGFVTRLVCVEPRAGVTAAQSDHFLPPNPGTELAVALAIAKLAADKVKYPNAALLAAVDVSAAAQASGISEEKLNEVAVWITDKASVILPGGPANAGTSSSDLAAVTYLLNDICGNIGKTVVFGKEQSYGTVSAYADAKALLDDARAGKVGVLFIDGANPVYNLPAEDKAAEALAAVGLVVQFANEPDDSTTPATLLLPPGSSLEGWGDANVTSGVHTLQQPGMTPLKLSRTVGDVLLGVAKLLALPEPSARSNVEFSVGDGSVVPGSEVYTPSTVAQQPMGFAHESFRVYVQERWKRRVWDGVGTFDTWWVGVRQKGGSFNPAAASALPLTLAALPALPAAIAGAELALCIFPSSNFGDGRYSNRPWAQELPDPISTSSWGSWAEIHPKTVAALGLRETDSIKVKTAVGEVTLGYFATPGVREDTVAIVYGNGHTNVGRYGTGRGVNPLSLISSAVDGGSGALATYTTRAAVTRSDVTSDFFALSGNLTMDGRPVAVACSADEAVAQPTGKAGSVLHLHEPEWDKRLDDANIHDFFPEPQHPTYRFAMAIDLNSCTGCGACIAACALENNIPFVGPDQVRRGRGMSWIRMDRFIEGEGEHLDIRHLPSMCQHCSHAPCEGVCPVLATYHNLDGLNAMIYNRCVGTRYCANNCPYTVRRFNYHTWTWPESMYLMLNPDVSVREMGVMEKCTYCVQRTRSVKDSWRDVHETVPDKALEKLTACASACPTQSITFGNLKDSAGTVSKLFLNPRTYTLFGELNTKPGTRYLAKARHHLAGGAPAHGSPAHGSPAHGSPAHGAPAHGEPTHGLPAAPESGHGSPAEHKEG